ncbi:MAG: TIGR01777 family oxidoreductase [bacterium]|nr:TIGR01777 family oxidoreductase [bacterium]
MKTQTFVKRVWIQAPAEAVFNWHAQPGAFERLSPPWERVEVEERSGGIEDGARVELRVPAGPFRMRWALEHCEYEAGRQFCDRQTQGPFRFWKHRHRMVPEGKRECYLEDRIEYVLPLGVVGRLFGEAMVEKKLERLFTYRHRITVQDLEAHMGVKKMKVLITGASGLVGSALTAFLSTGGHEAVPLVRSGQTEGVRWDPASAEIDVAGLEGFDAVVHLAGESIAEGRWTVEKKERIWKSRVDGTRLLCEALAKLERRPKVVVCASAIGYYGDRGEEVLDETSEAGEGFLAEVCKEWEAATHSGAGAGIRVVNLRFGVVLSPQGGALEKMLTPFRLGVGGRLGDGKQNMSWIALEDAVGVIYHAILKESLSGPVNAVAPKPVSNAEFTQTLARVLKRPALFPVPGFAARLAFGEMADALLLASTSVVPGRLKETEYAFREPGLEGALRNMLGT